MLASSTKETIMQFASVRIVTADVDRLVGFYEALLEAKATRPSPDIAEFRWGQTAFAISSEALVERFNAGVAAPAQNRSAILEFQVEDTDAVHARLSAGIEVAMPPATMPWGNRSMLLRDPDGNAVNIFARPASGR
jgi:uncharacterized glyoxalase superfamily protein PhnB